MRLFVSGATATLRRRLDPNRLGLLIIPSSGNTPQTALSLGLHWAADNAAFSGFQPDAFCGMLAKIAGYPGCRFVACPDVVGNATETLRQFHIWSPIIRAVHLPVALVGQDGMETLEIPWSEIDAFFVGGSTDWKLGTGAANLVREAKRRGLWTHMRRVNTRFRFRYAFHLGCDSVDGSGFSRWPDQRVPLGLRWLAELDGQPQTVEANSQGQLFRGGDRFAARGWRVEHVDRTTSGYVVTARCSGEATMCPVCMGRSGLPPYRHGSRSQTVWDTPHNEIPVKLIVRQSRYRCRACNAVFVPRSPELCEVCPITTDLAAWLVGRQEPLTQKEMSKHIGISTRTLRKWLYLATTSLENRVRRGSPLAERV